MVSVEGLTVEFGGTTLFSDISFQINEKDRIALMGKNGAGKSTMLKILAGVRQPTRGKVTTPKDCVVAYLPQHLMTEDGRTVFEEASQAFAHLKEMEAEIEALNKELAERTDYESDSYMALIEQVASMSEKFYAIDLTHFEEDVEKALLGLGFEREDFNKQTSEFSGGWRMRIELAKLLLQNPDVLLLDEPTNHLDIESIQWLEQFLMESAKAVVVISHDRKFVDNITTRTIEVTMGRIYDYKVNYSKYLELRQERRAQQLKQYEEQQKLSDSLRFFADGLGQGTAEQLTALVDERLDNRRKSLEIRKENGLLDAGEEEREQRLFNVIRDCREAVRTGGATDAFSERSGQEQIRAERQRKELTAAMKNGAAFVREAFGKKQELVIFLTGLREQPVCSRVLQEELGELSGEAEDFLNAGGKEEELRRKLTEQQA